MTSPVRLTLAEFGEQGAGDRIIRKITVEPHAAICIKQTSLSAFAGTSRNDSNSAARIGSTGKL